MGTEPARAAKLQGRGLSKSTHSTNAAGPVASGQPGVILSPLWGKHCPSRPTNDETEG